MDRFLVLAGAMKAGTTLLYQALRQHPMVAACSTKEPNWLVDPAARAGGLPAWRALWRGRAPGATVGLEASTAYTKLPMRESPVLHARRLGLDVDWVYVVRDPVARFESHLLHCLAAGWNVVPAHEGLDPGALVVSNYWFQAQPFRAFVDPRRFHVRTYRELAADPPGVAAGILDAIGLPPARLVNPGPQNASALYRNALYARAWNRRELAVPLPESEAGRMPTPQLLKLLAARSGAEGDRVVAGLVAEVDRQVRLSPAQRETLRRELGPDLERFADTYGVRVWDPHEAGVAAA